MDRNRREHGRDRMDRAYDRGRDPERGHRSRRKGSYSLSDAGLHKLQTENIYMKQCTTVSNMGGTERDVALW